MPTNKYWVTSAGDDVAIIGANFHRYQHRLHVGHPEEGSASVALRYQGITVPPGATITSVILELRASQRRTYNDVNLLVTAEDSPDPAKITSYADFIARPRTPTYVAWNKIPPWLGAQYYNAPSLVPPLYYLQQTYGLDGSTIILFLDDNESTYDVERMFFAYDAEDYRVAKLLITFFHGPPPPPDPLWLLIDQTVYWDGATLWITAVTDKPCHLTMRYQQTGIVVHPRTTIVRGMPLFRDLHLGFDNYLEQDQLEGGDTTTHTFFIEGYYPCKTYFWLFKGTIGGEESPSQSPVLAWHCPPGLWRSRLRPVAPGDLTEFPSEVPGGAPHWSTVDEPVLDLGDWCGKGYAVMIFEPKTDLFVPELPHLPDWPITALKILGEWYGSGAGAYHQYWQQIKTHGDLFESDMGAHFNPGYFSTEWRMELNPYTGKPWTQDEIRECQFGYKIWVADGGGAMQLLQTYLEIEWQEATEPL